MCPAFLLSGQENVRITSTDFSYMLCLYAFLTGMIGRKTKAISAKINAIINVIISYGNGTILHPHAAMLPAILIAVVSPPKTYEHNPTKKPIPNKAAPIFDPEKPPSAAPVTDKAVAPNAMYCAI